MKHRNWRNHDSPLEIHKQMSPNCSFVLEAIQEQIEDHKNRRVPVSYATGACGTTCELLPLFGILVSGTLVEGCAYVSPFSKYLFRNCLFSAANNSHVVPQAPVA
jgi:hypothetical protein